MDLLWFALENNFAADEVAEVVGLTPEQVQRAFDDFARKQKTTEPLRQPPLTVEPENKPTELEVLSA
jgi:NAD+ synthase